MKPKDLYLDIGIQIHARIWSPVSSKTVPERSYILVHGLSSNARTWDQVAVRLAENGHLVAAIDQRGHGLSGKPDHGYDFATISGDLQGIIEELDWQKPILVGQSWGGNVLLHFAAHFPGVCLGYVFVDGGFLHLSERGPWEQSAVELRPPDLIGIPRTEIADRIRRMNPGWSDDAIEATIGNFEILPDLTVRPWLTLERHLKILRAMYDQDPTALYHKVEEPVLICAADDSSDNMPIKRIQVQAAEASLKNADVIWFPDCVHDIHVDQPEKLAAKILDFPRK